MSSPDLAPATDLRGDGLRQAVVVRKTMERVLTLPLHPFQEEEAIHRVCDALRGWRN